MPPARTKTQILKRLRTERRRLEQNLAHLSQREMLLSGVVGEWSVKDVLAHLADWLERMPVWVEAARRGETVEIPEPGYTWKQVHELNQRIYAAHRDQSLDEVLNYFHTTYDQFMDMMEGMPEEEMLAHGHYAFTGSGAIYDWLNAYAAHDIWGKRAIRKWIKIRSVSEKTPT